MRFVRAQSSSVLKIGHVRVFGFNSFRSRAESLMCRFFDFTSSSDRAKNTKSASSVSRPRPFISNTENLNRPSTSGKMRS